MRSSFTALGVVGLTIVGLWYVGGGATVPPQAVACGETPHMPQVIAGDVSPTLSQAVAAAEQSHVSTPAAHENLTIFFIHGPNTVANAKIITLQEAMEAGSAVIHETGNVNNLTVENLSTESELFIQEGDIIRGGRQDRMIALDMLLPPKSGLVSFPCHCVEQGRWTARGYEAATQFNKSDQFAVGANLKYANATGQQGQVWQSVAVDQGKLAEATKAKVTSDLSASSLQLTLESPVVNGMVADYEAALKAKGESRTDILGVVFFVNGEMTGAEIYGSNALFQKAWPKLLRSAAIEALADKTSKPIPATPSNKDVEQFLAQAEDAKSPATHRSGGSLVGSRLMGHGGSGAGLGGGVGGGSGGLGGGGSASASTTLSTLSATPLITTSHSRGIPRNSLASSNFLSSFYGNPSYQGVLTNSQSSNNSPAGFGTPLFGNVGSTTQTVDRPASDGRVGHIRIEGTEVTTDRVVLNQIDLSHEYPPVRTRNDILDRVVLNQIDLQPGQVIAGGTPQPVPQSTNPAGNRLNINRVENAVGLVTESRDPTQQNAVIHKSFIMLGSNQK